MHMRTSQFMISSRSRDACALMISMKMNKCSATAAAAASTGMHKNDAECGPGRRSQDAYVYVRPSSCQPFAIGRSRLAMHACGLVYCSHDQKYGVLYTHVAATCTPGVSRDRNTSRGLAIV